jgi:hypothetical protein
VQQVGAPHLLRGYGHPSRRTHKPCLARRSLSQNASHLPPRPLHLNSVQYACALMYRARNAFLHGNSVTVETLLPAKVAASLSLPRVASTVFRTALVSDLLSEVPYADLGDKELSLEIIDDRAYARALKQGFALARSAEMDG